MHTLEQMYLKGTLSEFVTEHVWSKRWNGESDVREIARDRRECLKHILIVASLFVGSVVVLVLTMAGVLFDTTAYPYWAQGIMGVVGILSLLWGICLGYFLLEWPTLVDRVRWREVQEEIVDDARKLGEAIGKSDSRYENWGSATVLSVDAEELAKVAQYCADVLKQRIEVAKTVGNDDLLRELRATDKLLFEALDEFNFLHPQSVATFQV